MASNYPPYEEIVDIRRKLRDMELQHWLNDDLFSFNWWLILVLTIVFWMVWFKVVDRRRLMEITFFGAMIVVASTVLDLIGVNMVLWAYPDRLEPLSPSLIPGDLVMMPVSYMIVYQYYGHHARPFLIATTLVGLTMAFGIEPLLAYAGIYEPLTWKYIYSFPIYVLLVWTMRAFVRKLQRHQQPPTH